MNKRVWLFSLLIVLCAFCLQMPDTRAEDKASQGTVGLSELLQDSSVGGTLGSRITGELKALPRAGESEYPPFFDEGTSAPQPGTQPAPQPGAQNANAAAELNGIWAASNGQITVIMMFQGNVCCVSYNTERACGTYTAAGGQLTIHLQNGKVVSCTYKVQGNQLILNNGDTVLLKQQMPSAPMPVPSPSPAPQGGGWGGSSAPQGGGWGGSPTPQGGGWGTPAPSGGATPLEGCWVSTNMPIIMTFCFQGNQYRATVSNSPMVETGTFILQGDQLHYTVITGNMPGQRGINRIAINGNMLTMIFPNGGNIVFRKQ